MSSPIVGLFPGQGSLSPHVGLAWRESPQWSLTNEVREATGVDVGSLLCDSELEDLVRTDRAQLATFTLSLLSWFDQSPNDVVVAVGHSLGEYSALVAAGILTIADGARLVAARGAAMAVAAERNPGSMTALMGGDPDALAATTAVEGLWVANLNGDAQTVVAGTHDALAWLDENYKQLGWKRATRLTVGGAFHSPLMAPATNALAEALATCAFHRGQLPVVANVDAVPRDGDGPWIELLLRQLVEPVQFVASIRALDTTIRRGVEAAPSGVLMGLAKRIRAFDELIGLQAGEVAS